MKASAASILLGLSTLAASPGAAAGPAEGVVRQAGFDQNLNQRIPSNLAFRDETGRLVRLADYFGGAPLILALTYYGCSNVCPTIINNLGARLGRAARAGPDRPVVLVVSIDPRDTPAIAARKKAGYLAGALHDADASRWHFLSGDDADIAPLVRAAGFRYAYDRASGQYAHPSGFLILTPQGTISRYFFGFGFAPQELSNALDEAAAQRISSPVERLLLLCFHFDPATGRYTATVLSALQGMSIAMVLGLIAFGVSRMHRSKTEGR